MHKPMSEVELICHDGLSMEIRNLIEGTVKIYSDPTDPADRPEVLRGYLVGLAEENEVDDIFRRDLETYAASFNDGWRYCEEFHYLRTFGYDPTTGRPWEEP